MTPSATTAVFALIYPMVRDMPDLEVHLNQYPGVFGEPFNIEAITTGPS